MTNLKRYLQDGANHQARAVLCLLQTFDVEESWNADWKRYAAEPKVARWENCREQGYVVMLCAENNKCLNIAFFEHRNSNEICAVKWEQTNFPNSPTIDTAQFGKEVYRDKFDVSHTVIYGEIAKMADWIKDELEQHWLANRKPKNEATPATTEGAR